MKAIFSWNKTVPQIISGVGINKAFNKAMAETSARYMNPFVPMKSGILSQDYTTSADALKGYVTYTSPYAHRQYNGTDFNFSKEHHPLATHHWDKAMLIAKGTQLSIEANKIRKRFSK